METGHSENVVAAWFKRKTGKEIHRAVVGKSVRAGFHELDIDVPEAKRCRLRGPKWPLLDEGLFSGRETAEEDDGEPDSNYVEPLPLTLEEAKKSSLCLSEFVGDNIALFSEEGYRTLWIKSRLLHQRC